MDKSYIGDIGKSEGPKHRAIYECLREEILSGKYSDGKFPSENALVNRFGVARGTIRSALALLKEKRMLKSRPRVQSRLTKGAMNMGERLALIVPGISHEEIFAPICNELARIAQREGFVLMLGDISDQDPKRRVEIAKELAREYAQQHVAGVVFQPMELVEDAEAANKEILQIFADANIAVVLLDYDIVPPPGRSDYDLVSIDNFSGGTRIAEHLMAQGARRIYFLMRPNWAFSVRIRLAGVRAALAMAGHDIRNGVLVAEPDDKEAVRKVMDQKDAPDAFVCGNDVAAAKIIDTLRNLGYKVPEDVKVAGFDDVQIAKIFTPHLTTIHQPCEQIAFSLFEALIRRMRNPAAPARTIMLDAPLVVRESTSEGNAK